MFQKLTLLPSSGNSMKVNQAGLSYNANLYPWAQTFITLFTTAHHSSML